MAGGGGTIRQDPAIERWRVLRDSYHANFRFTQYATRPAVLFGVAVPLGVAYMAWATKDRWEWAGKRKGESLLRHPPPKAEPEEAEAEE